MLEPLTTAPHIGAAVGVLQQRRGRRWVASRSTVTAVVGYGIVIMADGTWNFYWNLTEIPPCS